MSAPIITPNLTDKLLEQMSQQELIQKSNELRAQQAIVPPAVPVPAADDVAGLPAGVPAPTPALSACCSMSRCLPALPRKTA